MNEQTQARDSSRVKWVLIKLASTLSVAEIEYNTVKPAIHFWLLTLHYQPFVASTIANFITTRFMKAGIEKQIEEYKTEHELYLQKISDYTQFLLKDKLLKKLVDYYLLNFENNEELINALELYSKALKTYLLDSI